MTEGGARGLLPDDHPNSAGFFDNGLNRAARLSGSADAVLLLGKTQDIILGYAMPPTIGPDAALVQVGPGGGRDRPQQAARDRHSRRRRLGGRPVGDRGVSAHVAAACLGGGVASRA